MMQEIHMTAIYWPIIAFKKHDILACVHVILRHFPSGTNWPTCRLEVLPLWAGCVVASQCKQHVLCTSQRDKLTEDFKRK